MKHDLGNRAFGTCNGCELLDEAQGKLSEHVQILLNGLVYNAEHGVKSCVSESRQSQEETRRKQRRRPGESLACRDILRAGISRKRSPRT